MKHKGGILLNILTPEKNLAGHMVGQVKLPGTAGEFTVLSGHAPLITSPGTAGEFTVLSGHAPLITSLTEGDIIFTEGGASKHVHIRSGFAEVQNDTVSACVEI